jgi:membrane-associated phospholipid phosphatase
MMRAMPALFHRLPRNLVSIFSGRNLVWHALAIALTAGIVMSGGDWAYYRATRRVIFLRAAIPAIGLGTLLPVLLPLGLLVAGAIEKKRRLVTTGWALGQSALLAWMVASAYKALTGRAPPPMDWRWGTSGAGSLIDTSHGFRFGFMRGGVFWGWPSGHTTVAFATMLCLVALYPKNKPLVFAALLYAFYVGLSVSVSIHWLSEFVAGAIIGSVIGTVVGRSFKTEME